MSIMQEALLKAGLVNEKQYRSALLHIEQQNAKQRRLLKKDNKPKKIKNFEEITRVPQVRENV